MTKENKLENFCTIPVKKVTTFKNEGVWRADFEERTARSRCGAVVGRVGKMAEVGPPGKSIVQATGPGETGEAFARRRPPPASLSENISLELY